ncbi:MAG: hypothetical protein AB2L22_14085 [Syntrophales bacterium]
MKETACIVAMAVCFILLADASVNSKYAVGCQDLKVSCCIDGDESKTVAKTKFTMCWSWSKAECRPCNGEGQWAYISQWCNVNYINECHGTCEGCFKVQYPFFMTPQASEGDDGECCVDNDGHKRCR